MALDVELYRRTMVVPTQDRDRQSAERSIRRLSLIDIQPEKATQTLIFVHGFGGSALQWVYQLRFFGQGARVVAPDLRGHGLSSDLAALPYSMDGLVDDLAFVHNALNITTPCTLIAHSFGGSIAVEYALRYPEQVSGLVLIGVPTSYHISPLARRAMAAPDWLFKPIRDRLKIALYAPPSTLRRMNTEVMARWDGEQRMPEVRIPTLVVLGHRDRLFQRERYEDVPRLISGAQQVVIPVSAHLVQLERPDAVNRALRRFIDARRPTGTPTFAAAIADHEASNRRPWQPLYDIEVPDQIPVPRQRIFEFVVNAARAYPNHPAIVFFGQRIGYKELDRLSNRFANALLGLGLLPGDRVAIVLPNVPQTVIAFYGTLKAGGVVVLGSPLSRPEEIAHQLRDSGARFLLTLNNYRATIAGFVAETAIQAVIFTDLREYLPLRQRVILARALGEAAPSVTMPTREANTSAKGLRSVTFQQILRSHPFTPPPEVAVPGDLALIQYTSGTVDPPKGVMLTHANLMVNVAQVRHWTPDARRGGEALLCVIPLSHSYGITDALNLIMALAGTLILLPTTRTAEILAAIKRYRPTMFPAIPAIYLAIANHPHVRTYGVSSVRICISGSAPLPVEVQEAFEKLTRGRLVEGYGLTEASPSTHSNPLKGERRVGSIGIPLPGTDARIVDPATGAEVPTGTIGELLIRGPQVMQGYWNMPEESGRVLEGGWLHTGDLAIIDEDGYFSIVERKKEMILSGPYNIYPREVEEVLYEHPKVLEVAVVGSPLIKGALSAEEEREHGELLTPIKAYVVLKRGEHATAEELIALCRERLDSYKVPRQIEFRRELPKSFIGKILRRLLVETS